MWKIIVRSFAIFLLFFAGAAWSGETREQTFVVGANVNKQGQVTQTQVDTDVNKGIASFLDLAVKRWQFVPAQQDGKAATVHTFIKVKLEVIPAEAGKYTLRLSYIKHGPKWDERPPQYPIEAVRERNSGMVLLLGKMDQDGRFDVHEMRTVLSNGHPGSGLKQAARTWLISLHAVPETVNQQSVAADARIVVTFGFCHEVKGQSICGTDDAYTKDEQQVLFDSGFKPPFDKSSMATQDLSSVLQTRMINPVTMQL